jgi:hypothetical protein
METVFYMVTKNISQYFPYNVFLALMDGIQNNDAFKHTGQDKLNETWTELMKDLHFWDDIDDHVMYLRRRWVLGSSEWMSGMHESKQNDKELLGYSDDEWSFIWATMFEDKAWAVPNIKDASGNFVKHNNAPEIFLKFIAHDLHCNIIIFDLLLNQIQFCSGNHLKSDNVRFDSPLLLYCTGGHFQSVFQQDHDFFINFAKKLETDQDTDTNNSPTVKSSAKNHQKDVLQRLLTQRKKEKKNVIWTCKIYGQ